MSEFVMGEITVYMMAATVSVLAMWEDVGLKYIPMRVPQNRVTIEKWEPQVDKTFCLPVCDGILSMAVKM